MPNGHMLLHGSHLTSPCKPYSSLIPGPIYIPHKQNDQVLYWEKTALTSLRIAPSKYTLVWTWKRPSFFVSCREWLRIAFETATANFSCRCNKCEPPIITASCPTWIIFLTWNNVKHLHEEVCVLYQDLNPEVRDVHIP